MRGSRRVARVTVAGATLVALFTAGLFVTLGTPLASAAGPCDPPVVNPVACENTLPGTPTSDWQIVGDGDTTIVGFATQMSVNRGQTVVFKIKTPASSYRIDILRLGYYQGHGARKVAANITPTASLPQTQPACLAQATTGLIDCGNWANSAQWAVPSNAVSGVYVAHLIRNDTGGSNQIVFVVRDDSSDSDVLFQTSDTTWQAYNTYGGNSTYTCVTNCPPGSPGAYKGASKVSYNRPFTPSADQGRASVYYAEFAMLRFLEANGYDMSYMAGIDVNSRGPLLLNHKVFVSSGHDEYWSGQQRTNVEAARDAGVSLAFFSGNEVFWKTRWENSIDSSATAGRTLVTYKDTHYNAPVDPVAWTGTWADPRFVAANPPNALTGQYFVVNAGTSDIRVPAQYGPLRLWRNTAVAGLAPGQTLTLGAGTGTLGYEWDADLDNGFRPAGLFRLSSTTVNVPEAFVTDWGTNVSPATVTHNLTLYRVASGALVFGAGTVQWSWGLDSGNPTGRPPDQNMRQATVNLFADMGAQPSTLLAGLVPAAKSTDTARPTSTITSPAVGANLPDGTPVTVSGTASDTGGGVVGGVEVSTDAGASWHPATGTNNWSYSWVVHGNPTATLRSRATDDSGNIETPSGGSAVNVNCPCSLWGPTATPAVLDAGDPGSVELGVKFTSDSFGTVNGIRFYKAGANTGTHIGNLWSTSGQLLATATFTGESASGWQQVTFANPVVIIPGTTYVASYFAPRGHYSSTDNYFYDVPPWPSASSELDNPPLHALRQTPSSPNGVYAYGATSSFPTSSDLGTNYWVDVLFSPSSAPGQATAVSATAGNTSATVTWTAPSTGGPVTTYTVTPFVGSTAQAPQSVSGSPAPTGKTLTGLTNGTAYTFRVTASNPAGTGPVSAPSNAVTPSITASAVINGGFEGGLSPWVAGGAVTPSASTVRAHSGSGSALLGTVSGSPPGSDSSVSQTVTVPPGTSTLTFWYWRASVDQVCSGGACIYDWQEAQIRSTGGATLATVFKSNANAQAWTQVTFDTSSFAGQTVVLWFNVHQDATPDPTSMYLDDVSLNGAAPTAPLAPTGVVASAGDASALVSWTAPTNGGSPITSYSVTPFVGSTPQTPVTVSGNPPATNVTVGGLTNGTAYTFTVTATNAIGTGPPSAASSAVTPSPPTAPLAPTGVTASPGNSSALVSWTAPSNGGSAITSYSVTPFVGSTPQTPVTVSGNPPATSVTVSGLTNGTVYTFTVAATNAIGTGPPSAASNSVTPGTASPPTVDVTVNVNGAGAQTTAPFSTSGAARWLYAFVRGDGPNSAGSQSATVSGAGLSWSLVRRTNARPGTAEVWAASAPAALTNVTVTSTLQVGGFRQALTVVAFAGSTGPGASASNSAATGAPTVSVTTTQVNSVVYAAGGDWDGAAARTVPANQTMVNQVLDTNVGTFWLQRLTAVVAASGTAVTINDTAPTNHQWNFAAVEIKGGVVATAAPTSTVVARTAGPTPSVSGQSVTFTATVSSGAGTPTGTVQFKDGAANLGAPVTLVGGAASLSSAVLPVGAHSITAVYAGNATFATSTSAALAHSVNQAATTTAITSDTPDPSNVGQAYTVQWTVTVTAPGSGTPTGNVTVSDGTDSCSAAVGAGQCSLTSTTSGAKTLTATYAGDTNFTTSAGTTGHTVNVAAPTSTVVTRSAGPNPSVFGQSVTFTATVSSGAGTPAGTVQFKDGAVNLGTPVTLTGGAANLSTAVLSAGSHSITAVYSGNATFATSTSPALAHAVSQAATTTAITSDAPDPSNVGQAYTVQWTVTVSAPGAGTPTGNVTVSDGTDSCSAAVGAGQCSLTSTTSGAKTLTATYAGDTNFTTSAGTTGHTVNEATPTSTVVARTVGPDPSVFGQSVTFTATVSSGAGTPTGTVQFKDGAVNLGTPVALVSGVANLATGVLSVAAHSITGVYSGDANFATSTSAAVTQTVGQAATTTAITSDAPDPSNTNQAYTVQWTVTVTAPGAGTPTGNVTVSDGTDSCNAAVGAGQCSLTSTTSGAKTLTATYAGDTNFTTSAGTTGHTVNVAAPTSPTVDVTVNVNGPGNQTTAPFSTSGTSRWVFAFVRADGPAASASQTTTVSGAGLTWSLVRRTNAQFGTAEVWAAFAPATLTNVTVTSTLQVGGFRQAMTVVAFANSSGPGASASNSAATGAPTVSVTTTQTNSLVYAAGVDWDGAAARTVPANQTMVNQILDTNIGTFWVQQLTAAVAASGTAVTINDTAPTNHRWNYTAVEIKGL